LVAASRVTLGPRANARIAKSTTLEPWFGPHLQRDIYLSLLHIEPEPGQEKSPAIPDSILKAALLQRAIEDIHRILSIRNAKPALNNLLQRGSVGDQLWQRFQRAEKEIEEEVRDVITEVLNNLTGLLEI
jgi:translocation protein SEC66